MTSTNSKPNQLLKLDSLGRARTDRAKRDGILDAFEASGMSGASFARQHGIRYSTFAYWVHRRRKLKDCGATPTVPKFAEVIVRPSVNTVPTLSIRFPGGANAEVHNADEIALAATLIREIATGGAGC